MKCMRNYSWLLVLVLIKGCSIKQTSEEPNYQSDPVFQKGEMLNSDNFTGTVWLHMTGAEDSTLHARFGNVTLKSLKLQASVTLLRRHNNLFVIA